MFDFFKIIIPARYDSTRLPGKVLLDICGKPMLQHVYERATEIVDPKNVIVATDSPKVIKACKAFGAQCVMTSGAHRSGTERLLEVVSQLGEPDNRIVVNMQADEPLLPPDLPYQVAQNLNKHPEADIATLYDKIIDENDLNNPNIVKVVTDNNRFALYFSRSPIPFHRDGIAEGYGAIGRRHIGIYAYRVKTLRRYSREFLPCYLEKAEMLEQLRLLYYGGKIHVDEAVEAPDFGVDTEEDLANVRMTIGLRNLNK